MPRRNPVPLSGALFIRNPKRNKRRNAKSNRRRNALALQENRRRNVKRLLNRIKNKAKANRKRNTARRNGLALQNRRWNPRRNKSLRNKLRNRKRNKQIRNKLRNRKRNAKRNTRIRNLKRNTRKNKSIRNRRKNALSLQENRRKNSRKNAGLLATATGSGTKAVKMVPFVGPKLSKYVRPAMMGSLSVIPVHFGLKYGGRYLPEPMKPVAYTSAGTLIALVAAMLPKFPLKGLLGSTAVAAGAAVDMYRMYAGTSRQLGDEAANMAGLSYDYSDTYGDGGAYELGGLGVDMGSASVLGDYGDAQMADAYYSGADMSASEGEAALRGAPAWRKQFCPPPVVARQEEKAVSRHAGRPGHRWGWMVKLLGWENFRKLAALPPAQRQELIAKLRADAVASVQAAAAPQPDEMAGLSLDMSGLHGQLFAGAAY